MYIGDLYFDLCILVIYTCDLHKLAIYTLIYTLIYVNQQFTL